VPNWTMAQTPSSAAPYGTIFKVNTASSENGLVLIVIEKFEQVSFMGKTRSHTDIWMALADSCDSFGLFLSSELDMVAAVLIKSIKVSRLDIVMHIIQSTLKCLKSLANKYGNVNMVLDNTRKEMNKLCVFALKCENSVIAAVIAASTSPPDKNQDVFFVLERKMCHLFNVALNDMGSDVDDLNHALVGQEAAMKKCPDADLFYGFTEHFKNNLHKAPDRSWCTRCGK
jgi:hypothetical protein